MTNQTQRGLVAHSNFLTPGCLEPSLSKFITELAVAGYSPLTISGYQQSVAHFGTWLEYKHANISDINAKLVTAFANHHCKCPGSRRHKKLSHRYLARVQRFIRYLNQQGLIQLAQFGVQDVRPDSVLKFREWMLYQCGISMRTVEGYERLIVSLLPNLGEDPARYNAALIRHAIESKATQYSRSTAQRFTTALRAYLRFLISQGRCRFGLESAVPTIAQWKLSTLPRYLIAEDLEGVIASYDGNLRCGLRNRAILLLLARFGLRAGDIVNMQIEDVDWYQGTLRVNGKGRREVRLPLPQDVGDALLAYLEQARPRIAIDQIFLCVNAPYRALPSSSVVSGIVRNALKRAGITHPPSWGTNLLRHSAATSMLRAGATLDIVSSVLRHRSIDTTAHYAKVDIAMLQPIAQPWPGGESC